MGWPNLQRETSSSHALAAEGEPPEALEGRCRLLDRVASEVSRLQFYAARGQVCGAGLVACCRCSLCCSCVCAACCASWPPAAAGSAAVRRRPVP